MTCGALGTQARYLASGRPHRMTDSLFPVGTLLVNSAGSLIIGTRLHKAFRTGWILWRINLLMPFLDAHVKEGLITLEEVRVIKYRYNKSDESGRVG
jgi:hypothetical protein